MNCAKCIHKCDEFCDIHDPKPTECPDFDQTEETAFEVKDGVSAFSMKWYDPKEKKVWWTLTLYGRMGYIFLSEPRFSSEKPDRKTVLRTDWMVI